MAERGRTKISSSAQTNAKTLATIRTWLRLGYLRSEKCELTESTEAFHMALKLAKRIKDVPATCEALSRLVRLACEALDDTKVLQWERELDLLMATHPKKIPSMAWYCKGLLAAYRRNWKLAQRHWHRYLRAVRCQTASQTSAQLITQEEALARAWAMLANALLQRGHVKRAEWLAQNALQTYEARNLRGINGVLYIMLGGIAVRRRELASAMQWYQKAHASFLAEHNWYYHLYVLYGYARVARIEKNYTQAYWYLDLLDKATSSPAFAELRREIARERDALAKDAVDLLIDSREGIIKTREGGEISLRKQWVLLHILEALSTAHGRPGDDMERGLSKAEIIERVWKENYRPEAHDNKLYYNINRLRKLIEPDIRKPQYLLNWKEGYRLAPSLRVHFVGNNNVGGNRS